MVWNNAQSSHSKSPSGHNPPEWNNLASYSFGSVSELTSNHTMPLTSLSKSPPPCPRGGDQAAGLEKNAAQSMACRTRSSESARAELNSQTRDGAPAWSGGESFTKHHLWGPLNGTTNWYLVENYPSPAFKDMEQFGSDHREAGLVPTCLEAFVLHWFFLPHAGVCCSVFWGLIENS